MRRGSLARMLVAGPIGLLAVACASAPAPPERVSAPPVIAAPAPPAPPLPQLFTSDDFIVTFARDGDTADTLASRHLGEARHAWMIEDYMGARVFSAGQEVVIPRRDWNPSGVDSSGYQLVPILCYHNLGVEAKGRLVLPVSKFEEQMRYLKANQYRVVSLAEFVEFSHLRRQLPRRSVVLTFDDGYTSFKQHAYPLLKELGFTATLFVYTDYVGAGRNALAWQDLRELQAQGFDIQAHTKTHTDLRRTPGETDAQYARRMLAELAQPQELFQKHLGRRSSLIAYPYGSWDEGALAKVAEHGYAAGFSVRRQGNASFARPLAGGRSQIYSEMTLEDFVKNLNMYQQENLK